MIIVAGHMQSHHPFFYKLCTGFLRWLCLCDVAVVAVFLGGCGCVSGGSLIFEKDILLGVM